MLRVFAYINYLKYYVSKERNGFLSENYRQQRCCTVIFLESASNNLQNNKKAINDLNVFPVPDGDTGTNMGLTFSAAVQVALSDKNASAGDMMGFLSKASLRNARGNSGVILSQILRGVSKALAGKTEFGVDDIKNAADSRQRYCVQSGYETDRGNNPYRCARGRRVC